MFPSTSSPCCTCRDSSISDCPHSPKSDSSSSSTPCGSYRDFKIEKITQSHLTEQGNLKALVPAEVESRQATTIDILPDNVFLDIFDLCRLDDSGHPIYPIWKWHRLAQVCRRWRYIIFVSPRRLDLNLLFTYGKPVWNNPSYLSAFPIAIDYASTHRPKKRPTPDDVQNIVAALTHPNRVHLIRFEVTHLLSELLAVTTTDKTFPALECLDLCAAKSFVPTVKLPDGFLCGSAPSLQVCRLSGISFPALPTLLSSANNLIFLQLDNIPPTGYVSPEAMVAGLAMLTKLESLRIELSSYSCAPIGDATPPETRIVLPGLLSLELAGNSKYLEHFLSQIDTPLLEFLEIMYLCPMGIRIPQLFQFINRSTNFNRKISLLTHAQIHFGEEALFSIDDGCKSSVPPLDIYVAGGCNEIDRQVSSMAQMLNQSSTMFSNIKHLSISCPRPPIGLEDMDPTPWPELFRPFIAAETLCVDGHLTEEMIALALGEAATLAVMVTEVLPALRLLDIGSNPKPYVDAATFKFVMLRGLFGRPVTIAYKSWGTNEGLESDESDLSESDEGSGSDFDE